MVVVYISKESRLEHHLFFSRQTIQGQSSKGSPPFFGLSTMYLYTFMHMYGLYITHIFRNIVYSSGIVAYINLDRYKRDEGKWIHIRVKAVTSKGEIRDPPYVRYVRGDESGNG